MGIFTEGYVQETVSIDENYSGILGCFQIVSDAIHNEQVMFECLFTLDYMDALNEADEDTNNTKRLGDFINTIVDKLKAKINSIIDSFISKLDAKKSKELKELAAKLPKDLSVDNEKFKVLVNKYRNHILLFSNDGLNKKAVFWSIGVKYQTYYQDEQDKLKNGTLEQYMLFKLEDAILGFYDDDRKDAGFGATRFLKNLQDPCYIIDKTAKDLRDIKRLGNEFLDIQKNAVSQNIIIAKKANSDNIEDGENILELIKSLQKSFPKVISKYIKYANDTYKAYLYSLKYLTSNNINESYLEELEESVNYDVDMEFDFI